jgi:hypothetical protein
MRHSRHTNPKGLPESISIIAQLETRAHRWLFNLCGPPMRRQGARIGDAIVFTHAARGAAAAILERRRPHRGWVVALCDRGIVVLGTLSGRDLRFTGMTWSGFGLRLRSHA